MHRLEKLCIQVRHSAAFHELAWLWNLLRDPYNRLVTWCAASTGLERIINGTDRVLVLPRFRGVTESYEPEVWRRVMSEVQPGDSVADVGAYIGLYSVALAHRVGPKGRLAAFEPDHENFEALEAHCRLNRVADWTDLNVAVSDVDGVAAFEEGRASESHISRFVTTREQVRCVKLDTVYSDRRLDVLKIDVEGHEAAVRSARGRAFAF